MVEFLISAVQVWCAVCAISFIAFLGIYLHFEFTQPREAKTVRTVDAAMPGELAAPAP